MNPDGKNYKEGRVYRLVRKWSIINGTNGWKIPTLRHEDQATRGHLEKLGWGLPPTLVPPWYSIYDKNVLNFLQIQKLFVSRRVGRLAS